MADSKGFTVLLFTSPATSDRVRLGLELARQNSEEGKEVAIVLMQDSVFLVLKNSFSLQGFEETAEIYALDEHLMRRGYTGESLGRRVKVIGYEGLAELLMREQSSVVGSF